MNSINALKPDHRDDASHGANEHTSPFTSLPPRSCVRGGSALPVGPRHFSRFAAQTNAETKRNKNQAMGCKADPEIRERLRGEAFLCGVPRGQGLGMFGYVDEALAVSLAELPPLL